MTITDEARQIRSAVAKLRPDKRRRYGEQLRARILGWVAQVEADGGSEAECASFLGIRCWRFRTWRQQATGADRQPAGLALVPIETPAMLVASPLALIAPSGHRIEGLSLEQAVAALRELA